MSDNILNPQEATAQGYISVKEAQELSGKAEITIRRFLRKIKDQEDGIPPNAAIQVKRAGGKKHYTYVSKQALFNYFGMSMPEEQPTVEPISNSIEVEIEPMETYQSPNNQNIHEPTNHNYNNETPNREANAVIPINEHKDIINQFVIKLNEAVEKEHQSHAQLAIAENNLSYKETELDRTNKEVEEKQQTIKQLKTKHNIIMFISLIVIIGCIAWADININKTKTKTTEQLNSSQAKLQKSLISSTEYKTIAKLNEKRVGELTNRIDKQNAIAEELKIKLRLLEKEKNQILQEDKKIRQELELLTTEPNIEPSLSK